MDLPKGVVAVNIETLGGHHILIACNAADEAEFWLVNAAEDMQHTRTSKENGEVLRTVPVHNLIDAVADLVTAQPMSNGESMMVETRQVKRLMNILQAIGEL